MSRPRGMMTKDHAKSRDRDVNFVPYADNAVSRKRCDRRIPRLCGTTTKDHSKFCSRDVNFVPCADNAVAQKRCAKEARARCFARQQDEWENKLVRRLVLATSASLISFALLLQHSDFLLLLSILGSRDLRLKGLSFWPLTPGMIRTKIKRARVRRTRGECL